jgi:Uma2 family endonuclease
MFIEQRIQISKTRFRIPDVCVYMGGEPPDQIFRTPPFICIEVLSPEDRLARAQARIDDYLKFGVAYVWVIDPASRRAWAYTADGSREIKDGELKTENPSLRVCQAPRNSPIEKHTKPGIRGRASSRYQRFRRQDAAGLPCLDPAWQ